MIKLVVSDMDGTLLGKDSKISPANEEAIVRIQELGVPFVLCTGRIYSAVAPYADYLKLTGPVIGCNGAIIKNHGTGETLFLNAMQEEVVCQVIDIFRKYDHYFHFYDEDTVYAEKSGPLFDYIVSMSEKLGDKRIKTKMVEDTKVVVRTMTKVLKMGFNLIDETSEQIADEIRKVAGLTVVQSAPKLLDVMNENVSKGEALKALAAIYNISTEEILAMGDNDNDIEMLQVAGVGVAMGNAGDKVKAIADDVAVHHEEDGVAWTLEKYVLSR